MQLSTCCLGLRAAHSEEDRERPLTFTEEDHEKTYGDTCNEAHAAQVTEKPIVKRLKKTFNLQ